MKKQIRPTLRAKCLCYTTASHSMSKIVAIATSHNLNTMVLLQMVRLGKS